MKRLQRFFTDRSGATAIEYALIAGATALALIATIPQVGTAVSSMMSAVGAGL